MRLRSRRVTWIAAALVAVYVTVCVAVPRIVDAERFRSRVETRLSEALGRRVTLGRLELSLWTGIAIEAERLGVAEAKAPPEAPPAFEADRISIRPAILPLIRGEVRLRSVALRDGVWRSNGRAWIRGLSARLRVGRASDGASRVRGTLSGSIAAIPGAPSCVASLDVARRGDRLALMSLHVTSGAARLDATGEAGGIGTPPVRVSLSGTARLRRTRLDGTVSVEGLPAAPRISFRVASSVVDFGEIAAFAGWRRSRTGPASASGIVPAAWAASDAPEVPPSLLAAAAGAGTLEAKRALAGGVEAANLAARVTLDQGKLRLEDAEFDLYGGRLRGSLGLDLVGEDVPFAAKGRIDGVDVDGLISAVEPSRGGALHGVASMEFDLRGTVAGDGPSRSMRGTAHAGLRNGRLSSVGILKQVADLLEMVGGRGIGKDETPFDHVSATFELGGGQAVTRDLEFRSGDLDLDGGGAVGLDGALRLDVLAAFSRASSGDLVRRTPQLKFRLDPGGRLTLPLKIRGDLKTPVVQLDLDRVLKEGLERSVLKEGKREGLLRRLFGRD